LPLVEKGINGNLINKQIQMRNQTKINQKTILFSCTVMFIVFCGCASSYKPINPVSVNYTTSNLDDGISFSYRYDVLGEAGNKKYSRHEKTSFVKLVAVKITNLTGQKINLGSDVSFFAGTKIIYPLDPLIIKSELKQGVGVYLLYLLLTPVNLYTTNSSSNGGYYSSSTQTYPIGYILGPGISLGNILVSSSANQNFQQELLEYNINKDVENGQTIYALVGFRDIGYEPLTLKLKDKKDN
jgi:hypothetical protein